MKGLFIPEITAEEFRNGCPESIEALMAEGEIYDIEYSKWISVSEGLPEKNGWYSCTVELSNWPDSHYVTMDLYFKNGKWLDNRRIDMFNCYEIYGFGKSVEKHRLNYSELIEDFDWTEKVIAWMPLPKTWEVEE